VPRARRCSFCGRDFPLGTGLMYVKNDGSLLYFCSSKCRRSAVKLGRDARKLRWTKYYGQEEKGRA